MDESLQTLTDFAEYLADEAGKVIRPYFRQNFAVSNKENGTPVTDADKKAEEVMRKLIDINYPDHGIFGEEFGEENTDKEYVWVLDPIDGTTSFISGRPTFGILISLLKNKKPIIGVVDQPIIAERWVGADKKTELNYNKIRTRKCNMLEEAVFATTSPDLFQPTEKPMVENIVRHAEITIYGGDCYSYGQLAMGGVDVVVESGLQPYDFMALVPVVENAGGIITDWKGEKLSLYSKGDVIACGDAILHQKLISEYLG
ncbi:MAG: histidinol-phosphatase [Alphaproteobacteria bacterium CG11_big_fil_rev_8_21_14_0_20_44_7]|nr:MAG: histidinol-phosphatase [Alphaproteobacteria bacterium CG11_big_fil_rev_8_21_14_0_20_44_7]